MELGDSYYLTTVFPRLVFNGIDSVDSIDFPTLENQCYTSNIDLCSGNYVVRPFEGAIYCTTQ